MKEGAVDFMYFSGLDCGEEIGDVGAVVLVV
jgi:hypothetical protein